MQPGPPTGHPACRVGDQDTIDQHEPMQLVSRNHPPASHTGTFGPTRRLSRHPTARCRVGCRCANWSAGPPAGRSGQRIILTRPAVEAGESLGFLPGDLQEKVDPYLRPLYDALFDLLGYENYEKLVEKKLIEVAPLAYMRGRTLDNAFIILDEAQNTTNEQMKMFLTRLGYGSKAVVTGDITQTDLPKGKVSGLISAEKILKNIIGIGFIEFSKSDVVRHQLVQKIIEAYESYED